MRPLSAFQPALRDSLSGIEQVAELEHASGPLMLNEAEAVVDILLGGSGE